MKASAVICEYNPFHNGHKYMLDCIKRHTENAVVAIMSGSFTQRGDVAVYDKFARAKAAIENGADLVTELPTVYAVSSAHRFASAGFEIAAALGCCEELCFGCEDNIDILIKAADAFKDEQFNAIIRKHMQNGTYYPQAIEKAMCEYSEELCDAVKKPNNILALEYLKALDGTSIKPFPVKRVGAEHDSKIAENGFASASYIRKLIRDEQDFSVFSPMTKRDNFADINNLERAVLYKLRLMSRAELAELPEVNEGLENRLYDNIRRCASVEELLESVKTKRYTHARLRRIITYALLGITADMQKEPVPYLRVLAFNGKGAELMGDIKRYSKLPLITRTADYADSLSRKAKEIFEADLRATDLQGLASKKIKPCGEDFTRGIIK